MKYRKLGSTGMEVSEIALGCWPFAGGSYWGRQDEQASIDTVHASLDAGINLFDSAEGYEDGESERVLGRALSGRRREAIIATKVSTENLRPADVAAACERSLSNLGTDYVDLYQIHWPNHDVPIADTAGALQRLKEQGKIRAIGVSNFAVRDLADLLGVGECVSDQLPYSLLWRVIEREIQPFCVQRDVGIICYSPLAQGLLTGRYRNADEVPEGLAQSRWYSGKRPAALHDEPGVEAEVFDTIHSLRRLAEEAKLSMATMALAWVRAQPGVSSFLVGARSPDELARNLPALEIDLPPEILERLSSTTETVRKKLGRNPDMWLAPGRMR
ncbi:MAG: aldo/keto reductase [Albidovulum sp.]|nr:aldo/keto reductase [Albidovulum sp.]MDE0304616.1 aldo/keto reductase [Albidovulum sp.]MDE0531523.1 aldo/keto reductase [Albidovulum sp.]